MVKYTFITSSEVPQKYKEEGYFNLGMKHPTIQKEKLLESIKKRKEGTRNIKTVNTDIIDLISLLVLINKHDLRLNIPEFEGIVLKEEDVTVLDYNNNPVPLSHTGYKVDWMEECSLDSIRLYDKVMDSVYESMVAKR